MTWGRFFIKLKEERKVTFKGFLSSLDFWKATECITSNLKLNIGGKLVKKILSKFKE